MSSPYLDFSKDYIFENSVAKLSPLKLAHVEVLAEISKEKDIWTYFLKTGQGGKKLKTYIQEALHNRSLHQEYPLVIFDKRKNQYAGMTRLYEYNEDLSILKMGHTWLGKDFWGTRLNTHCKFLLFEFIFETLHLERIGFGVHSENLRSITALQNMACQQEGVLRNFLRSVSGKNRADLLLFGLLKNEWKDLTKNRLAEQLLK